MITVEECCAAAQLAGAATFSFMSTLIVAAAFYWALTIFFSFWQAKLETRMARDKAREKERGRRSRWAPRDAHETITDEKGRELIVKVEGLQKYFGKNHVLKGVDLEVDKGEVVVLIGPSGSGKSTFLRCLNFLEDPTTGEISVGGVHVTCGSHGNQFKKDVHEIRMKCGMVFQEFNLFPHKDATENVTEGPILVKGLKKEEAIARPTSCSPRWASPSAWTSSRASSPAARSSASPSPAPWPWTPC